MHYINVCYDDEKVKEAILLPKGSAGRRQILLELENRGNYQHNVKVICVRVIKQRQTLAAESLP